MFVIVLNQNNIVQDGQNNKLVYKFPSSIHFEKKFIAVTNISMFYSWFNITSLFNNNTFTYTFTVGGVSTPRTVTIPDGLYEISAINDFFQWTCIQQGTYYITSSGDYAYPAEFLINPTRYAIQINTFYLYTAATLPTGWTLPANFPGYPTTRQNCIISLPANINAIMGYLAGFTSTANVGGGYVPPTPSAASNYEAIDTTTNTLSYISNTAPQVQPNNNVLFSISNINNPYAQPSSIIYSLNPSVASGQQINVTPPNYMWNKLIDGYYPELRLTLLGTNLQPLTIFDPNMTILLAIKDEGESSGK